MKIRPSAGVPLGVALALAGCTPNPSTLEEVAEARLQAEAPDAHVDLEAARATRPMLENRLRAATPGAFAVFEAARTARRNIRDADRQELRTKIPEVFKAYADAVAEETVMRARCRAAAPAAYALFETALRAEETAEWRLRQAAAGAFEARQAARAEERAAERRLRTAAPAAFEALEAAAVAAIRLQGEAPGSFKAWTERSRLANSPREIEQWEGVAVGIIGAEARLRAAAPAAYFAHEAAAGAFDGADARLRVAAPQEFAAWEGAREAVEAATARLWAAAAEEFEASDAAIVKRRTASELLGDRSPALETALEAERDAEDRLRRTASTQWAAWNATFPKWVPWEKSR